MKKKNSLLGTLLLIIMIALGAPAFAENVTPVAAAPTETPEEHLQRLERRLEEIKAMDFDKLSRAERRELRGEVRAIKKEAKAISGVYISVGALLIIILLIVLLA
jgi:hypothetical protein